MHFNSKVNGHLHVNKLFEGALNNNESCWYIRVSTRSRTRNECLLCSQIRADVLALMMAPTSYPARIFKGGGGGVPTIEDHSGNCRIWVFV